MNFTRDTLQKLSEQISVVSQELLSGIEDTYAEERYVVSVGERYRVGCAHRDRSTPDDYGLGQGNDPGDIRDLGRYVQGSSDFNDFLLHRCDSSAVRANKCVGGVTSAPTTRLDMGLVYGEGADPLNPPMKMPLWRPEENSSVAGTGAFEPRHACLELPCLDHP